jgi:hypothetical protein
MSRALPSLAAPANSTFSHLFQLCYHGGRAALPQVAPRTHACLCSGSTQQATAFVLNCLMYARRADAADARRVFDAMPYRDTVLWNTVLTVFSHFGDVTTAMSLFYPDAVSWNALVSSYC